MKRKKIADVMNMSLMSYDYYLRNIKLKFHTN
nr:hypothetical protein [Pantoea sp. CCBC3-3-1]